MIGVDSRGLTQLAPPNVFQEFGPAWSPDSSTIAFHSNLDGQSSKIYVVSRAGGKPTVVTTAASDAFNPAWAPDGQEIVYQLQQGGAAADLY